MKNAVSGRFCSFTSQVLFYLKGDDMGYKDDIRKKMAEDAKKLAIEKFGEIDCCRWIGQYLYGLPEAPSPNNAVLLFVDEDYFIFREQTKVAGFFSKPEFKEVGRIRRDSINQVLLEDRSTITQRLTATRIATLGFFSLAAPKQSKYLSLCLLIDYDDKNGEKQNILFHHTQQRWHETNAIINGSNFALNMIKKYMKPKVMTLKPDEKKCPFCAEIIKKEAKLCRYCRSELN